MAKDKERVEEETEYDELMFLGDLYQAVCHTDFFPMIEEGETHDDCPESISKNEFIVYPFCGAAVRVLVEPLPMDHLPSKRIPSDEVMSVELVMILEDGHWDTLTTEVPACLGHGREKIIRWVEYNLAGQAQYRNVIAWQIHSYPNSEEDDGG